MEENENIDEAEDGATDAPRRAAYVYIFIRSARSTDEEDVALMTAIPVRVVFDSAWRPKSNPYTLVRNMKSKRGQMVTICNAAAT